MVVLTCFYGFKADIIEHMLFIKSLLGALVIDVILAVVFFWLLPQRNAEVSLALKIGILAVFPLWSVLTYVPKKRALSKEVISPAQAMVGKRGRAITRLNPEGTVRINFEIWNATSSGDTIEEGEQVTVLSMDGLVLTVQKEDSPIH
ncbi:NfeD family protein [Chloroflexota bacterium]